MKKTLKIAIAGGAVGVVSIAGAGLASAHGPGNAETLSDLTDRAAAILGVDATDLADALSQARDEVRSEEMDARLAEAVADGTITRAEADEIKAWLDARPQVLDELKGATGRHARHDADALAERLATLVENGDITRAEADEVLAWSQARPDALDELRPGHEMGHGRRGPGRGFHLRMGPGAGGEIGRFGGFLFSLPSDGVTPQADTSSGGSSL